MSETAVIPYNEKLAELQQKLEALKARADSIEVKDQATYIEAAQIRLDVVAYQKALGFTTGPRIEELKEKLRVEEAAHKMLFAPSVEMLTTVDKKRKTWADAEEARAEAERKRIQDEVNRKAKEKADADAAEAKRIADEHRKAAVDSINKALKAKEITKKEAAKLLKEAGAEAEAAIADAEARAEEAKNNPPPAPTVVVKASIPTVRGTRKVSTRWWAVVINPALVPDDYWVLNQSKLDEDARRLKAAFRVPGAEARHD